MSTMWSYYTYYILEHLPLLSLGLFNMKYNSDVFRILIKIPVHYYFYLCTYVLIISDLQE